VGLGGARCGERLGGGGGGFEAHGFVGVLDDTDVDVGFS